MTGKEAVKLSGRSETWLRNHECAWCGQTLWRALMYGCGAIYEKCEPEKKSFGPEAKLALGVSSSAQQSEEKP